MVGLHWFSFLTNWLLFWLQCVGSLSQCNHAARSGNWRKKDICISLGKHRGACAFHPAHFFDQSQASFSSHGFLTKTVHQVTIECYLMLYIIYSCFLRLQVSLVTIIMIIMILLYILSFQKAIKQSPKGACFWNTSEYNIPEANPANPLPVSVLQRYPLEDHKDCRQGFWSTWPVDLGFWNMCF